MTLKAKPINAPFWSQLTTKGCRGVETKELMNLPHLSMEMLRFEPNATIHEHPADHDIDVICLVGQGFASVGDEKTAVVADERVRLPAKKPHRLWTTTSDMVALVVEHIGSIAKNDAPTWEDVDSSMISAFKYDPDTQTLDVIFNRTGLYSYFEVPPDVIEELRESDSKGSFMRYAIIDRFYYEKGR